MNLADISLRVAALAAVSDYVADEYAKARKEAEAAYQANGIKSLSVSLPGGEWLADITVKKPGQTVKVNEDDLMAWVEKHTPTEVEEYLDSAALLDQELIEWAREHRDDLLRRRIRQVWRSELQKMVTGNGGYVIDSTTGDSTKVAEVTTSKPTGAFALSADADKSRRDRVMAALLAGELNGVTTLPIAAAVPAGGVAS